MYDYAHRKYGGYQFTLSGHSQGGLPNNILLDTKKASEGISLNPAHKGESQGRNE
jgi:hypothetical protein